MRILRFIKALFKYILYGHRVDFYTYVTRLNICSKCDYLKDSDWTCSKCGCYLTKKTKMSSETCPDNKWNKVD